MFKGCKVSVAIPCYNEENCVGEVIRTMPYFVDHIVVVDDGSTDRTSQRASEVDDGRVVLIRHIRNEGLGAAVVTAHRKAMELGADVSVVMAGDGQMDPRYLPKLLTAVAEQGCDYTKANRFLIPGHTDGMPRIRLFGNLLLTLLTKVTSGYWNISDPQNGYTAVKTAVLRKIELDRLAKGYQFENDMLVHLNLANARVRDVPIPANYNGQPSKIKLHRFLTETSLFLIKRFFYRIYKRYMVSD